jgi:serine/threonine-protein kinase
MSKPNAPGHSYPNSAITVDRPPVSAPPSGVRPVVMVGTSGQHLTTELSELLRRRLRIATLIFLCGSGAFLVRNLIEGNHYTQSLHLAVHALSVAVMTLLATLLWSHLRLSVRMLRLMEVGLFATMGAFFVWLQFVVFRTDQIAEMANPTVPNSYERVMRLAASNHTFRWFMLIVVYGTFIPNTWRRCALVVGFMAVAPIVLTMTACSSCAMMGRHTFQTLFDMIAVLAIASAIAIFGSYKISELQQEALAARKLGQYRLKRRLGAGGMGEVYLGEHMLLRRACAIKLIRGDQAGEPNTLNRFEREVRAMATLTHPNTVEVYDYGRAEDGTFYYVMEYLPGLSLQDLVERFGPLSVARAVYFLRQLCGALYEAHSIGLIHRDIKPSNVIACERGGVHDVAKLLDFGLVQSVGLNAAGEKLTMQGTILGSPSYMSPEQALGKNHLDARTDIYSLGATAYFLLTGHAPYERETPMETLVAHVHEPPPALEKARPELPEDVVAVVNRCLRKDPLERYQDADSLEQALAACACAGEWDRHEAAAWWREYRVTDQLTDAVPSSPYEPTADLASGSSAL